MCIISHNNTTNETTSRCDVTKGMMGIPWMTSPEIDTGDNKG